MTKLFNLLKGKKGLEERVKQIQEGDVKERNSLIKEYIPFIQKNTSNQVGKFIDKEDDAYSIGLMAFNEALDKYNEGRGSFLAFASMVIKSRVVDYQRKQSRLSKEVYLSQFDKNEEDTVSDNLLAVDGFEATIETKLDMMKLISEMKVYEVSLEDLIKESPKHIDTRIKAVEIARYIYDNPAAKDTFLKDQQLPVKEIMDALHISKKTIQRSRKFIIAMVLILNSNLDTLKQYIIGIERRGQNET
ncbi:RNA polymerase sigma-I factor [Alkaliphilus serpentinus]|uniref:RNA polymerase sigma-I factor n=1 Tax=Alkaliphilus serpentinus TaxID=1482731 RepID=UPI001FAA21FA|nr:RNA polymerase sigma-I factor [Alkaliphilus serpentinus]